MSRTCRASILGLAAVVVVGATIYLSRRRNRPWWVEGSPEYPR